MTYKGTVRSGAVVLESPTDLPEGAAVRVRVEGSGKLEMGQALEGLPDDAQLEDVIERVYLFYKISRGVEQLDAGQGVPHDEARKQFSEWLE